MLCKVLDCNQLMVFPFLAWAEREGGQESSRRTNHGLWTDVSHRLVSWLIPFPRSPRGATSHQHQAPNQQKNKRSPTTNRHAPSPYWSLTTVTNWLTICRRERRESRRAWAALRSRRSSCRSPLCRQTSSGRWTKGTYFTARSIYISLGYRSSFTITRSSFTITRSSVTITMARCYRSRDTISMARCYRSSFTISMARRYRSSFTITMAARYRSSFTISMPRQI